jgi:hypothetical protein
MLCKVHATPNLAASAAHMFVGGNGKRVNGSEAAQESWQRPTARTCPPA